MNLVLDCSHFSSDVTVDVVITPNTNIQCF